MDYKILKAEILYDKKTGELKEIRTTADMNGYGYDIRKIGAKAQSPFWMLKFKRYAGILHEILYDITAHGQQVE
jgi:hypothetical protein